MPYDIKELLAKFREFWRQILKVMDFKMDCPILVIKTGIVPMVIRNRLKEKL